MSALIPPQKYRISAPLVPEHATQIDEMLQDLFDGLRNSLIGGAAGVLGNLSGYSLGDILYISTSTGTMSGLSDVAVGSYLRSGGLLIAPLWSTLTLPNTAVIGDIPFASAANVVTMLADVAAGSYLRSGGVTTAPLWSTLTLPNTATLGDVPYASATNVLSLLVKDTNATRYLSNTGVSNIPAWAQVSLTQGVSGDLPFSSFVQATATAKLVGRSTAGAGDFEEVSLGAGLYMTGGALTPVGDYAFIMALMGV